MARLRLAAAASTMEQQICLAEEGFDLACLPRFAIRRKLDRGEFVGVLEDNVRDAGTFHIRWPASRRPYPKLSAFLAFMAESLLKQEVG